MWVYCIKNRVNKKVYVGITKHSDPQKRWKQHLYDSKRYKKQYNSKLYPAIQKYGISKFEFIPLEQCKTIEDLSEKERYYIEKYKSAIKGYNIAEGGYLGNSTKGPSCKKYIKLKKKKVLEILKLYQLNNLDCTKISGKIDVPAHLVRRTLKENNVKLKRGKRITLQQEIDIRIYYEKGVGSPSLSKQLNVSEDLIRKVLRKQGVLIRTHKESNNIRNKRKIIQCTLDRVHLNTFNSIIEAMRHLGYTQNNGQISLVLDKKNRSYKGFIWLSEDKSLFSTK
jgi:group I intron endonuclease